MRCDNDLDYNQDHSDMGDDQCLHRITTECVFKALICDIIIITFDHLVDIPEEYTVCKVQ